jgi:hypothetical protein
MKREKDKSNERFLSNSFAETLETFKLNAAEPVYGAARIMSNSGLNS